MTKEVAEKKNQMPAVFNMESMAGAGFETATADDYAVPYIAIVQKTSKIIDKNPDARPGMFYNSVSGELFTELLVQPCSFKMEWIEWVPHDQGGGLVNVYDANSGIDKKATQSERGLKLGTNDLVDTRKHYCMVTSPNTGEVFPAIISMAVTQAGKSKKWMTTMSNRKITLPSGQSIRAPMFAYNYILTTEQEKNDKGSWYSFVIKLNEQVTSESELTEAFEFYKAVSSGDVKESDIVRD